MLLSQISVHYAFINDRVDLVSTGYEMEHFKFQTWWILSCLKWFEVCCQTTFAIPDEAHSPIPAGSQFSWDNVWQRAAELVWAHSEFQDAKMTAHQHDLTRGKDHVVLWLMCTCLMRVSQVDPLFRNWQSDCCHSIAWMKFEAKVLKTWCLRPFISAVWYFSFAMFDSLTEVDI